MKKTKSKSSNLTKVEKIVRERLQAARLASCTFQDEYPSNEIKIVKAALEAQIETLQWLENELEYLNLK